MNNSEAAIRESSASKKAVPVYELTPIEYRIALDAASTWLAHHLPLLLRCDQPALLADLVQRLPFSQEPPWQSGLWLEPQRESWQAALLDFSTLLQVGSRLAVLLSLPPAQHLPERSSWSGYALGEQKSDLDQFRQALPHHGFRIVDLQGLHSGQAIFFNAAALAARKLGRLALGDRLEFAARQRYIQPLSKTRYATCAILLAERY